MAKSRETKYPSPYLLPAKVRTVNIPVWLSTVAAKQCSFGPREPVGNVAAQWLGKFLITRGKQLATRTLRRDYPLGALALSSRVRMKGSSFFISLRDAFQARCCSTPKLPQLNAPKQDQDYDDDHQQP